MVIYIINPNKQHSIITVVFPSWGAGKRNTWIKPTNPTSKWKQELKLHSIDWVQIGASLGAHPGKHHQIRKSTWWARLRDQASLLPQVTFSGRFLIMTMLFYLFPLLSKPWASLHTNFSAFWPRCFKTRPASETECRDRSSHKQPEPSLPSHQPSPHSESAVAFRKLSVLLIQTGGVSPILKREIDTEVQEFPDRFSQLAIPFLIWK